MRLLALVAAFMANFALAASCLPMRAGHNVEITGTLEYTDFPGPPNYKSIAKGDRRETAILLKLSEPVCVEGVGIGEIPFKAENVDLIQLAIPPKLQEELRSRRNVTVRGELYDKHTGHHRTEVLMSVTEVR
jgi:hypothetical protein